MEIVRTRKKVEPQQAWTTESRVLPEKEALRPLGAETSFHLGFQDMPITERTLSENAPSAGIAPMTPGAGPRQGPAQMSKGKGKNKPQKVGYYEGAESEIEQDAIPWASHGRNTRNRFDEEFRELYMPRRTPPQMDEAAQAAPAEQSEMEQMQALIDEDQNKQRQALAERIAQRNQVRGKKSTAI